MEKIGKVVDETEYNRKKSRRKEVSFENKQISPNKNEKGVNANKSTSKQKREYII